MRVRELAPQERLQPALLDRLTDEEPDKQVEGPDKRVLNKVQLRQAVLRDPGEELVPVEELPAVDERCKLLPFVRKALGGAGR
jgi:hypothetical protein